MEFGIWSILEDEEVQFHASSERMQDVLRPPCPGAAMGRPSLQRHD